MKSAKEQNEALLQEMEEAKAAAATSDKEHIERGHSKDKLIAEFQNR